MSSLTKFMPRGSEEARVCWGKLCCFCFLEHDLYSIVNCSLLIHVVVSSFFDLSVNLGQVQ